jgi:hypothetical protein
VSVCSGTSINLNELAGVTAVSPSDAWASGSEGNVSDMNFHIPYVLHWNGTAWSLVRTPTRGAVFAVGARDIPGQCCLRTLALKTTSG